MQTFYLHLLSPRWSLFLFLGHSLYTLLLLPKHAKPCLFWAFKSPLSLAWDRWWLFLFINMTGFLGLTRKLISECIFLEVISTWVKIRLSKDRHFHQCGQASSNPLRAKMEQNGNGRVNSFSFLLSLDYHFFLHSDIGAPGSWVFDFRLGNTPLVLMSSDSDWITSLNFLVLQLADGRLWGFVASINAGIGTDSYIIHNTV